MTFGVLVLGLLVVFRALGLDFGRFSLPSVSFQVLAVPLAQCRAMVWVLRSLFEAQDYCFSCSFKCRLADTLLSPGPRCNQGTLSTHRVARACLLRFFLCVVSVLHFQLDPSPPRGAVGNVSFRFGYSSFPHFPPPSSR